MRRTRRFSGAARAAAALIGIRIAAGRDREESLEARYDRPPDWLSELDEYEDGDELSRALYSPLGEMIEARIAPEHPPRTAIRRDSQRRGTCQRTRP